MVKGFDGNLRLFWRFPVSLFSRIRTTEPLFRGKGLKIGP